MESNAMFLLPVELAFHLSLGYNFSVTKWTYPTLTCRLKWHIH